MVGARAAAGNSGAVADLDKRRRTTRARVAARPAPKQAKRASLATVRMLAELQAERQRAARMCEALAQYVPAQLIDRLMANPDGLGLVAETRVVTVLFADVRGFTRIAEAMKAQPERLSELVRAVLEPLTEIVLAHGGVLDKYMGDCVMAFWGAPDDDPEHASRALDAARAMVEAMPRIDARIRAGFAGLAPLPPIEIGVGLNSGPCVVGNVGGRRRWDYSVLGDPVNVASRLQDLCKTYGRSILAGEDTARCLGEGTPLVEIDRTLLRGRDAPQGVFAIAPGSRSRRWARSAPAGS